LRRLYVEGTSARKGFKSCFYPSARPQRYLFRVRILPLGSHPVTLLSIRAIIAHLTGIIPPRSWIVATDGSASAYRHAGRHQGDLKRLPHELSILEHRALRQRAEGGIIPKGSSKGVRSLIAQLEGHPGCNLYLKVL